MADLLVKAGHEVVSYQPINSVDFNDTGVKLARNIQRQPDFDISLDPNIFGQAMWRREGSSMLKMMKSMQQLIDHFALSCERE
ncbi:hypothetical protein M3Y97_00997600 [Aphelenchoides bicaudatus]|nr:hypothetical protein M3Y97_00997600 [Aphelenchoides bicaudatus]